MNVDNQARQSVQPSSLVANTFSVRRPGAVVEEVQAVRNSSDNALVLPSADLSNPGCTLLQTAVPASLPTGREPSDNGVSYSKDDGKAYIEGGGGKQIAVYSLDNWKTVQMFEQQGATGVFLSIRRHCGHWRFIDDAAEHKVTTPVDWLEYGLIGDEAPKLGEEQQEFNRCIDIPLERFDFQQKLYGDFLQQWFLHDWFNPLPESRGVWPAWAIKYAKPEAVMSLYLVQKLLENGAFPCEAAVRAYEQEIKDQDKFDGGLELLNRVTEDCNSPDAYKHFHSRAILSNKKKLLFDSKAFDKMSLVHAYINQFEFPKTLDGDVLKIALLSARHLERRTPDWAGHYMNLECGKAYFRKAESLPDGERQSLLTRVLADGCYGGEFAPAKAHLAKFAIADRDGVLDWKLLEELFLDKLLDGGQWAAQEFPEGPPRAGVNRQ